MHSDVHQFLAVGAEAQRGVAWQAVFPADLPDRVKAHYDVAVDEVRRSIYLHRAIESCDLDSDGVRHLTRLATMRVRKAVGLGPLSILLSWGLWWGAEQLVLLVVRALLRDWWEGTGATYWTVEPHGRVKMVRCASTGCYMPEPPMLRPDPS